MHTHTRYLPGSLTPVLVQYICASDLDFTEFVSFMLTINFSRDWTYLPAKIFSF